MVNTPTMVSQERRNSAISLPTIVLATASNLGVIWATWYLAQFDWWFAIYALKAALPIGLGGLIALVLASFQQLGHDRRTATYLRFSYCLYGLWLLYLVYSATTLQWFGH